MSPFSSQTEREDCPLKCSEYAFCARNGTSFECVCTRGYIGDGKECIGESGIQRYRIKILRFLSEKNLNVGRNTDEQFNRRGTYLLNSQCR